MHSFVDNSQLTIWSAASGLARVLLSSHCRSKGAINNRETTRVKVDLTPKEATPPSRSADTRVDSADDAGGGQPMYEVGKPVRGIGKRRGTRKSTKEGRGARHSSQAAVEQIPRGVAGAWVNERETNPWC